MIPSPRSCPTAIRDEVICFAWLYQRSWRYRAVTAIHAMPDIKAHFDVIERKHQKQADRSA